MFTQHPANIRAQNSHPQKQKKTQPFPQRTLEVSKDTKNPPRIAWKKIMNFGALPKSCSHPLFRWAKHCTNQVPPAGTLHLHFFFSSLVAFPTPVIDALLLILFHLWQYSWRITEHFSFNSFFKQTAFSGTELFLDIVFFSLCTLGLLFSYFGVSGPLNKGIL